MHHHYPRNACPRRITAILLLTLAVPSGTQGEAQDAAPVAFTKDPVVARIYEHLGAAPKPLVVVVAAQDFSPAVWRRVKDLSAFRLHRSLEGGTTRVDSAVYLVRSSSVYTKAAAALGNRSTNQEYVWCLLAAVLAHEAAHTTPQTERQALMAEGSQLRRCLFAGHLHSSAGWSAGAYLQKVEAKLRNPREHH